MLNSLRRIAVRRLRFLATGALIYAVTGSSGVWAQSDAVRLEIPAMSLEQALNRIAAEGHAKIEFDAESARGLYSKPVHAASVAQAIQQAVSGTPLSMKSNPDGSFMVGAPSVTELGEIVVYAPRNEAESSYSAQAISSATRDGVNLRDQPVSTSIVTAKVIADQQLQTITDALRNASDTTVTGQVQGTPNYSVRGFTATATSGGLSTPLGNSEPVANVERIEVLKGPSAILAGAFNLGGVVNIVSKHPTTDPLLDLSTEFASYGEKKIVFDGSTALDKRKAFSGRFVAEADTATSDAAGYQGRHEYLLAPSVRYKTDQSDFTLGAQYSDVRVPGPLFSAFTTTGALVAFPRGYGPDATGFTTVEKRIWFEATQKLTPWLTLSSRGIHSNTDQKIQIYGSIFVQPPPGLAVFNNTSSLQKTVTDAIDTYVRMEFPSGPLEHTLVTGVNYSRYQTDEYEPPESEPVFASNYLLNASALTDFAPPNIRFTRDAQTQDGVYLQDTLKFDRLHVTAGARYSQFGTTDELFAGPLVGQPPDAPERYSHTSPNLGAVYDVTSSVSIFANYLEGYIPNFAQLGQPSFAPRTTKNLEGGFKLDLFAGRLALVGSYYRLRQYNLTYFNAATQTSSLILGEQSKGVDLDLRGTLLPGWQVISTLSAANYTALQSPTSPYNIISQPKTRGSLFTLYQLQGGPLRGLGAAIGVYTSSSSYANFAGTRVVPGGTEVDANLLYSRDRLRLNVGVTNLGDATLYNTTSTPTYLTRKPPRAVRATLTYSYF